jgi:hypothetical protein
MLELYLPSHAHMSSKRSVYIINQKENFTFYLILLKSLKLVAVITSIAVSKMVVTVTVVIL